MKELVKLSSLVPWLISSRDIWVSAGSQALSLVCRDRYLRKRLDKSPWEKTIQRSLEIWEWEVVGGKAPTIKALEFLACYQMMKFMGKIKHARRRRPLLWEGSLDRLEGAAPVDGGERTFQTEGIVSMEGCWDSHNSWASVCGRVVVEVMCILEHPPGSWRPCLSLTALWLEPAAGTDWQPFGLSQLQGPSHPEVNLSQDESSFIREKMDILVLWALNSSKAAGQMTSQNMPHAVGNESSQKRE